MKEGKRKKRRRQLVNFFRNKAFQRTLITVLTVVAAIFIIESISLPKKYKLSPGEKSGYDITAPRDIENTYLKEKLAKEAMDKAPPVMLRLANVPIDIINTVNEFINEIRGVRQGIDKSLQEKGVTKTDAAYEQVLEQERTNAAAVFGIKMQKYGMTFSGELIKYLVNNTDDEAINLFDELTRGAVSSVMKEEVNIDNLAEKIDFIQNTYQNSELPQELKDIGSLTAKALLKPNSIIDETLTNEKKTEAYNLAMENRQTIIEGTRIISYGDIVTEDKLKVLAELNLLETGKLDFAFFGGVLSLVLLLAFLLILYMRNFCRKMLNGVKEVILLCVIILMTLMATWLLNPVKSLLIPIFIAPMLISILLDLRLGIVVNLLLALSVSFAVKGNVGFLFTVVIGGTIAAYIVHGANQRSRMPVSGLVIAALNAAIIASVGLIEKSDLLTLANNAAAVAVNGLLSTIFTIGTLPFFESSFNIITPLKLLEMANPNQPLMKKLLMEAPGTYHHSLMVGNLAEVAAEAINGNALLARVGAYYHDVGKLKRPNFFKENQLSDNPHDRMTPNLSTLVITAHTSDGAEIAEKYKVPLAIRNIISQHHGTTLVAYFYYKAKKTDKSDSIKPEDFRYQGPRPNTKEAAVVMLADSVEAAIRSMVEKTEGKMEGLIRKIIKDKLDDGQLDLCDLTLKDMDMIAKAFARVFGGYFHEREEYPEAKIRVLQGKIGKRGLDRLNEDIQNRVLSETVRLGEGAAEISVAADIAEGDTEVVKLHEKSDY